MDDVSERTVHSADHTICSGGDGENSPAAREITIKDLDL